MPRIRWPGVNGQLGARSVVHGRQHKAIRRCAPVLGHELWEACVKRRYHASSAMLVCLKFAEPGNNVGLRAAACTKPSKHGAEQVRRVQSDQHPRAGAVGANASITQLKRICASQTP